ncbi:MAG: CidA/LrgA family protein [Candidatus Competibacterales bacterium]
MGSIALLLVFQLAGELVVLLTAFPVPGPVVGMVLLLCALVGGGGPSPALEGTGSGLLGHLSLLFVPAGVGIIRYGERLVADGVAIVFAVVVSTGLAVAVTAVAMDLVQRRRGAERDGVDD